jgi:hypothetical protein
MWNIVGIQGSLVSNFLGTIYITNIIVGEMYNKEAVERSLNFRVERITGYQNSVTNK